MMNIKPIGIAGLLFCTWAVYLGGLASLQADCNTDAPLNGSRLAGIGGFDAALLSCSRVYRFYWFIMSWEFACIAMLCMATVSGRLHSMRNGLTGMLAVGTMLYIMASNTFLTALSTSYYDDEDSTARRRMRATTAGAIMTAAVNAIAMLLMDCGDDHVAKAAADKTAVPPV